MPFDEGVMPRLAVRLQLPQWGLDALLFLVHAVHPASGMFFWRVEFVRDHSMWRYCLVSIGGLTTGHTRRQKSNYANKNNTNYRPANGISLSWK